MVMKINGIIEGYSGKEWKRDDKHRVYIVGPKGEVGYFDLTNANFNISPKASVNFGICEEEGAAISLETQSGKTIYLGVLQDETPQSSDTDARQRLQEAIKSFNTLTTNAEKTRVEINLGPTMEFRIKGRSHWAKANLTVSVDNGSEPLDIESLYDATSEMVTAMLDLETQRFTQQ